MLSSSDAHALGKGKEHPELKTVDYVDLNRYLGRWYEISAFELWFEKGCKGVTADYSLLDNGRIRVVNSCYQGSLDGKLKVANGKARVVDTETNAKLKVSFFWPFSGDYWILELGANYEYAVVGSPDRETLWVLARAPTMAPSVYAGILDRMSAKAFDVSKLRLMEQKSEL
jgi:apolipoprotein D and lipocalin family protein